MPKHAVTITTPIRTSPGQLWNRLADFDRWRDWHRVKVELEQKEGVPVRLKFWLRKVPVTIRLEQVDVEPGQHIRWVGYLPGTRWLLHGVRTISVAPMVGSQVMLTQHETFDGLLAPVVGKRLCRWYSQGYRHQNQALKHLCE